MAEIRGQRSTLAFMGIGCSNKKERSCHGDAVVGGYYGNELLMSLLIVADLRAGWEGGIMALKES